ncbi:uncharacterized protein (DUF427 family) [Arthrobacter sp. CAN_A6]|uniref:DUF427 domain-containing protein n=1 Tax=Arthrobacter sp. CAN_A6 TaxID=2787721 RepID=UPI0018CB0FCB
MKKSRIIPGPGQESVWDYPRPPRVEQVSGRVGVRFGGTLIADTTNAVRVLETSHPPVYYLPLADFAPGVLVPSAGTTFCEFKGEAAYFDVGAGGSRVPRGAWTYPRPVRGYEDLSTRAAIYPGRMDSCEVDGEIVQAQDGDFYGGWITEGIVGPFKGAPGTWGW